ncbi:hypothetical protein P0Y35_03260 [Kiritimatiellaeota bacterium B1221]|nr:hypothetical protein [Kiritimatiellaeota bacterium B1221]
MKKVFPLFLLLLVSPLHGFAETQMVYLGRIDLAGMVPDVLPACGSSLHFQSCSLPLTAETEQKTGYIPGRFREAIEAMRSKGLELQFEVDHVYASPLPGKFLSVEVWVYTSEITDISPLVYSIPVIRASELSAMTE